MLVNRSSKSFEVCSAKCITSAMPSASKAGRAAGAPPIPQTAKAGPMGIFLRQSPLMSGPCGVWSCVLLLQKSAHSQQLPAGDKECAPFSTALATGDSTRCSPSLPSWAAASSSFLSCASCACASCACLSFLPLPGVCLIVKQQRRWVISPQAPQQEQANKVAARSIQKFRDSLRRSPKAEPQDKL